MLSPPPDTDLPLGTCHFSLNLSLRKYFPYSRLRYSLPISNLLYPAYISQGWRALISLVRLCVFCTAQNTPPSASPDTFSATFGISAFHGLRFKTRQQSTKSLDDTGQHIGRNHQLAGARHGLSRAGASLKSGPVSPSPWRGRDYSKPRADWHSGLQRR